MFAVQSVLIDDGNSRMLNVSMGISNNSKKHKHIGTGDFFVKFPILKANLAIYIVIYHNESLKIENPSMK